MKVRATEAARRWRRLFARRSLRAPDRLADAAPATQNDPALARWQSILDGTYSPSLVLDCHDVVIGSNAMADAILPNSKGQPFFAVSRAPELLEAIRVARETASQRPCHIAKLSAYHGAAVAIITPLAASPPPGFPALLVAIRDLTEAEALSRMRADFVANASHELRTPLASLKGFIETLQGAAKDDPAARDRFLEIMHEQSTRMSRLIDDLLSLSRVEMQVHLAPTARVDVGRLVSDAIRDAQPAAGKAGIVLSAGAPTVDLAVTGDADQLRLLLQNLLQNAIRYGRRGGRVDVAATMDGRRAVIAVTDDGIGIAPEHLPRLTERFYRVSTQESRARGGTGLGLAIVKHIVNRHRGELLIVSELGRGSTFTVKLPIAQ